MPPSVRERLLEVLQRCMGFNLDIDDVKSDSRLVEDLGMDSLDGVEFVMEVEDEFDIDITDIDAMKWTTFEDVVEFVEEVM